jgi:hypothetical protein
VVPALSFSCPMSHNCKGQGCTAKWGPNRKCHCTLCGENFSSPTGFDKHQQRNADPIVCDPKAAGLELNARGVYAMPGEEDISERFKR